MCDEVGTIFPDPKDLSKDMDWLADPVSGKPTFPCPYCGVSGIVELVNATDDEISAAGFKRTDYE